MGIWAKSGGDLHPHARGLRFRSPLMMATQRSASESTLFCVRGAIDPIAPRLETQERLLLIAQVNDSTPEGADGERGDRFVDPEWPRPRMQHNAECEPAADGVS